MTQSHKKRKKSATYFLSTCETTVIHKCKKVIHFVNYKHKLDSENYYREWLLLYTPWRCKE